MVKGLAGKAAGKAGEAAKKAAKTAAKSAKRQVIDGVSKPIVDKAKKTDFQCCKQCKGEG